MEYLNDFIDFEVKKIREGVTMVQFELRRELSPEDLKAINPPDPVKNKFSKNVVVLSGRGPVWLYGFLVHFYHPTSAVAIFDPRLGGAVVVESHNQDFKVGDLIKIEEEV